MNLNKKFIEKWITALRSGEYKQGRDVLFTGKKHCCLGVAACILPKYMGAKFEKSDHSDRFFLNFKDKRNNWENDSDLPDQILGYIGMSETDQFDLIDLNDNQKFSFNKIATYLEKKLANEIVSTK